MISWKLLIHIQVITTIMPITAIARRMPVAVVSAMVQNMAHIALKMHDAIMKAIS